MKKKIYKITDEDFAKMKKVNHWINGKNVAGNDYFQTTNPATGEVLADVASGGEAEINQAVAAAKEAFPKWANLPMKERARLMRRLGDLIDQLREKGYTL